MPDTVVTVNQTGGTPDFTSIAAALASPLNDVTDGFYRIEIEDISVYDEQVLLGGSNGTPTIDNYLWLTVQDAAYHAGVPKAGARIQSTGAIDPQVSITQAFTRLEKVEVILSLANSGGQNIISTEASVDGVLIERVIVDGNDRNTGGTNQDSIEVNGDSPNVTCYNCVVFDSRRGSWYYNIFSGIARNEFCSFYLSSSGESGAQSGGMKITGPGGGNPVVHIYNCVGADTSGPGTDFDFSSADTITINGGNNASEDTSANQIGTGFITGIVPTAVWTDPANFDLSLNGTGSALYQAGVDQSATPPDPRVNTAIDITGATRPNPPSIGAYDIAPAGGVIEGEATLTGSAALTASGERARDAQASLGGSATLTANGTVSTVEEGQAALAGAATVTAGAQRTRTGAASLAAAGAISADAQRTRDVSADLASSATLTANGETGGEKDGQAVLIAAGALSASGDRDRLGQATLTGSAALTATGETAGQKEAQSTLTAAGSLLALGARVRDAQAALTAAGTLSATGGLTQQAQASLAGSAILQATGTKQGEAEATATLTASGVITAVPEAGREGAATLAATGTVTADGGVITGASATLSGSAALQADGLAVIGAGAALTAVGALFADAVRTRDASASLAGSSSLDAAPGRIREGSAALSGTALLTARIFLQPPDEIELDAVFEPQISLDGRFQALTQLEGSVRSPPALAQAC